MNDLPKGQIVVRGDDVGVIGAVVVEVDGVVVCGLGRSMESSGRSETALTFGPTHGEPAARETEPALIEYGCRHAHDRAADRPVVAGAARVAARLAGLVRVADPDGAGGMSGTLAVSWGPWGGFYLHPRRVCLGWLALTYVPVELDNAYTNPEEAP